MAENPFAIIEARFNTIENLLLEIKQYSVPQQAAPTRDIGDIKVAQEVTGLTRHSIYRLVSERKIPHSKKGGRLYFSRKALLEWIQEGNRKCK